VFSILFHGIGAGLLFFGFLYSPHLDTRAMAQRYNVRRLDLDMPDAPMPRPAQSKVNYPVPKPQEHATPSTGKPSVLRQVARAPKGPQTLLQPDLAKQLATVEEVPVPTLMIWTPSKTVVKTIVAPQPAKPTTANVTPSPAPPIEEMNLADISIATSALPHPKLPALPSTTSPIGVPGPEVVAPPTTVSQISAKPTPAAVMSLSNLAMPQGTVVLPPVNETTADNSQGPLAPGEAENSSHPGRGDHDGKGGAGETAGNGAGTPGNQGNVADGHGPNSSQGQGNNQGNQFTATRITMPRNGQFGAVVVGAALGDIFPELTQVWAGRLAYTVYLHVGLARSWILQYSLPMGDNAATMGTIAHVEAPWPYNIVRPNLGADAADSEAIMVHGYVNQSGRFEGLRVVFPPQYPQSQFVLGSLQQWQFRPAARDGQIARVEVLLIIPEEMQ
jgi:hypothetical protein